MSGCDPGLVKDEGESASCNRPEKIASALYAGKDTYTVDRESPKLASQVSRPISPALSRVVVQHRMTAVAYNRNRVREAIEYGLQPRLPHVAVTAQTPVAPGHGYAGRCWRR